MMQHIPSYVQLIQFQGMLKKNYTACISLLQPLLEYRDVIHNNVDIGTLFRCFVQIMDTDNDSEQLEIIILLCQIVQNSQNYILGPFNVKPVLIAAIAGHYNTVVCLLQNGGDAIKPYELFEHLYEMELSIGMLILRTIKKHIHDPCIINVVGNCISNNNIHILKLIAETYPTKYTTITGSTECQQLIHNMQYGPVFVPTDRFFTNVNVELDPFLMTIEREMFSYTYVSLLLKRYLNQFVSYHRVSESIMSNIFVPNTDQSIHVMFESIHEWWFFVHNLIVK
jgi:hypothetical protein